MKTVSNKAKHKISKTILFLCALFSLSSCFAPEESKAPCKGLHKVENIDDLLGQFYANIDSHCLFEMPLTELEDIWGIKIFNAKITDELISNEMLDEMINERRRYDAEMEGFYLLFYSTRLVDPVGDNFTVILTNKTRLSNQERFWGDSPLSQGKISTLPKADATEYMDVFTLEVPSCQDKDYYKASEFDCWSEQIWFNSKKSKKLPSLRISASDLKIGTNIRFCRTMKCE